MRRLVNVLDTAPDTNDTSPMDIADRLLASLKVENPHLLRNADIAEAANEIKRLRADRAAPPVESRHIDRDELWALFVDHYWDSLAKDRDLILCHISSVLITTPPAELSSGYGTEGER